MHRRVAYSAHSCTPCTHTTVQQHTASNVIVKFADDTTVIGLITDNDETAYREEVSTLTKWWSGEPPLTQHRQDQGAGGGLQETEQRTHTHHHRQDTCEAGEQLKFLGVHITEDLTWSAHTDAVLKKAHQRLFFLRRLRKFGTSPRILRSFYTCTVESILTGCITAWLETAPLATAGLCKGLNAENTFHSLIILCIIVYVTNKAHPSLICLFCCCCCANCPPHCWR